MKNGLRMSIMYEKDRGRSKVKFRKWWQSQDWRQEKWCCVCSEIGKESFTTSCCRPVKRLILTFTVNNWKDYAKQSRENDQNWSIGKASSSITTTIRSHTSLTTRQKLKELSWEVLMHPYGHMHHLLQFFAQKSQKFYNDGIMILP